MKHIFKANLHWMKSDGDQAGTHSSKNHSVLINNKAELRVSAAKVFKGDANLYNPEDLLLTSLTSCHMMSYLYCCSTNGIEVLEYEDNAEAILEVYPDNSGKIIAVVLRPRVLIADLSQVELALSLHQRAHELCFIANSCNFEIEVKAEYIGRFDSAQPKH